MYNVKQSVRNPEKTKKSEKTEKTAKSKATEKEVKITEEVEYEEAIEVYGLVPSSLSVTDDMRRIADINDEFSRTLDPILRMYNAAMNVTETRMNIIKDEFKYRGLRCPIHHIDTRLKSTKSILGKLEKKGMDLSLSAACNNIYDIAGKGLYQASEGERIPQSSYDYSSSGLFYE